MPSSSSASCRESGGASAMRYLVTGGCGFIGRNLIRRLLGEADHCMRIVDNFSVGRREDVIAVIGAASDRVEFIEADIADAAVARRVAVGSDAIIHLAANTGVSPSVADPRHD